MRRRQDLHTLVEGSVIAFGGESTTWPLPGSVLTSEACAEAGDGSEDDERGRDRGDCEQDADLRLRPDHDGTIRRARRVDGCASSHIAATPTISARCCASVITGVVPPDHVGDRRADQARHERGQHGQEAVHPRRLPRHVEEPDRERHAERAQVARRVHRQTGVLAQHERGDGQRRAGGCRSTRAGGGGRGRGSSPRRRPPARRRSRPGSGRSDRGPTAPGRRASTGGGCRPGGRRRGSRRSRAGARRARRGRPRPPRRRGGRTGRHGCRCSGSCRGSRPPSHPSSRIRCGHRRADGTAGRGAATATGSRWPR